MKTLIQHNYYLTTMWDPHGSYLGRLINTPEQVRDFLKYINTCISVLTLRMYNLNIIIMHISSAITCSMITEIHFKKVEHF